MNEEWERAESERASMREAEPKYHPTTAAARIAAHATHPELDRAGRAAMLERQAAALARREQPAAER